MHVAHGHPIMDNTGLMDNSHIQHLLGAVRQPDMHSNPAFEYVQSSSQACQYRWNTPLDEEDVAPEEHRATWGQGEAPPLPAGPPSRKRPHEEEDEIDEDVKRRLAALQGGGLD